jgi:hypothetical protein
MLLLATPSHATILIVTWRVALLVHNRAYKPWMPALLQPDLDSVHQQGLARVTTAAHGDSLLEITRIEALPSP